MDLDDLFAMGEGHDWAIIGAGVRAPDAHMREALKGVPVQELSAPEGVLRAMRFVDGHGQPTEAYPFNPNGSPDGLTAVTTADGRFTVLMPHPERVFRNVQMSWTSGDRNELSPWMRIWRNARKWVG